MTSQILWRSIHKNRSTPIYISISARLLGHIKPSIYNLIPGLSINKTRHILTYSHIKQTGDRGNGQWF